jgi:hypothetical protein
MRSNGAMGRFPAVVVAGFSPGEQLVRFMLFKIDRYDIGVGRQVFKVSSRPSSVIDPTLHRA